MMKDEKGKPGSIIRVALDKLSLWIASIAGVAVLVMMLLMTGDAVGRKIVGTVPFAFELAVGTMAIVMFLPQAYAQMRRAHIAVDIFSQRLPPKAQAILTGIAFLLGAGACGLLTWLGWGQAWKSTLVREAWWGLVFFPIWPFRWVVPLGAGLLTAQFIRTTIDEFGKVARKE